MPPILSEKMRTAIYAQESQEVLVWLLHMVHEQFEDGEIYICNDPTQEIVAGEYGIVSNGQEYIYTPFRVTLPPDEDGQIARTTLRIDNITRELSREAQEINGDPIVGTLSFCLADQPDHIEASIAEMQFKSIRGDKFSLECDLFPEILDGEQFPAKTFNNADFPGLYSGF
jgi:hypothetical protein